MDWKYFIPHVWEGTEGEKHAWEDMWLLPLDPDYKGKSIWFTLDSMWEDELEDKFAELFPEDKNKYCGEEIVFDESGCFIHSKMDDMVIDQDKFTKDELLYWTEHWLKHRFGDCGILIEGEYEDFKNTNDHATMMGKTIDMMEKFESEKKGDIK